jgi:hypothetical protein
MACIRWTSRDNNDSIYPCVNSIYDNIQMFVSTWSHKFSSNWNMQTEAYYTYQRSNRDLWISHIRLSDKTSRLHPRHVVPMP